MKLLSEKSHLEFGFRNGGTMFINRSLPNRQRMPTYIWRDVTIYRSLFRPH